MSFTLPLALILAFAGVQESADATQDHSTCSPLVGAVQESTLRPDVTTRQLQAFASKRVAAAQPAHVKTRGVVRLRVFVEGDAVHCIRVLEGHPLLIPAAMEAAKQWEFKKKRPSHLQKMQGTLEFEFKG